MNDADFNAIKKIIDVGRMLHFGELTFKPADRYLTQEGYPLGTTCWYIVVETFGKRKWCCGDTPILALHMAAAYAETEVMAFVQRELERLAQQSPAPVRRGR